MNAKSENNELRLKQTKTFHYNSSPIKIYPTNNEMELGVSMMFPLQVIIPALTDASFWWLVIVFLIIALIAVIVIGFLFAFPIAALAAIVTYFLTGSLVDAGIVFLVVALISEAIGNLAGYGRKRTVVVHEEHHEH